MIVRASLMTGSSPLTRGKPAFLIAGCQPGGLIPAHAGKTELAEVEFARVAAHPRSRGENATRLVALGIFAGSSPLTRRKPSASQTDWRKWRLIPAHAGKTRRTSRRPRRLRAHPRSRGENMGRRVYCSVRDGSSPLTRGKRDADIQPKSRRGLIPAHAGKTR